jgi:peptidylprolyl isomerase
VPISANLDGIKVTGNILEEPTVEFTAPFAVGETLTKVLVEGDGATIGDDWLVDVWFYGAVGRTGEKFQSAWSDFGMTAQLQLDSVIPGFKLGLSGQKVGSRVLIAMPGSDAYDSQGGLPDAGIEVGDTLVFVVDIVQAGPPTPQGKTVTPPADLPKVTEADGEAEDQVKGQPLVEIPSSDPPSKLVAQYLVEGDGPELAAEDTVYNHYVMYSWKTKKQIAAAWSTLDYSSPLSAALTGLVTGLEGKTVGSRVLLVLPPADSYPEGSNEPAVEKGDTIVMVVDILMDIKPAKTTTTEETATPEPTTEESTPEPTASSEPEPSPTTSG